MRHISPKRKRQGEHDNVHNTSSSSDSLRDIPHFTSPSNDYKIGSESPRSIMAGQLQDLNLDGGLNRKLNFEQIEDSPARKIRVMTPSETSEMDHDHQLEEKYESQGPRKVMFKEAVVDSIERGNDDDIHNFHDMGIHGTTPEHADQIATPLSTSPKKKQPGKTKVSKPRGRTSRFTEIITPSSSTTMSRSRSRKKSPPPSTTTPDMTTYNPLTWHDDEITGINPTDPTDDGYGINGIGFRVTPSMAYQRSQKRMQQVSEWKKRVAMEERQRRNESRRRGSRGSGSSAGSLGGSGKGQVKKVRVKWSDEVRKA